MVRFYGFSRYELDMTQSAPIFLFLEQYQPLFRVGFPSYLSLLPLCPIALERWVIGGVPPCDFGEACDRGCVGLDQFRLSFFLERPVAIAPKVARFYPFTAFVWVSAFGPFPQHLPLGVSHFLKGIFGCAVSVVVRPSSYDWIECLDYFHSSGLLMCVQVGANSPHMLEDFFLLGDGQQCSPVSRIS